MQKRFLPSTTYLLIPVLPPRVIPLPPSNPLSPLAHPSPFPLPRHPPTPPFSPLFPSSPLGARSHGAGGGASNAPCVSHGHIIPPPHPPFPPSPSRPLSLSPPRLPPRPPMVRAAIELTCTVRAAMELVVEHLTHAPPPPLLSPPPSPPPMVRAAMELAVEHLTPPASPAPLALDFANASAADAFQAEAAALDLLLGTPPPSVLLGPSTSLQTSVVGPIASVMQVPMLAYAATDPLLNANAQLPYFVRVHYDDYAQMAVVADLVGFYNWTQVVALFESTDSAWNGFQSLTRLLQQRGTARVVASWQFDSAVSAETDVMAAFLQVRAVEASVFVLHLHSPTTIRIVLKTAAQLGLFTAGYVWIATAGVMSVLSTDHALSPILVGCEGMLGTLPFDVPTARLADVQQAIKARANTALATLQSPDEALRQAISAYDAVHLAAYAAVALSRAPPPPPAPSPPPGAAPSPPPSPVAGTNPSFQQLEVHKGCHSDRGRPTGAVLLPLSRLTNNPSLPSLPFPNPTPTRVSFTTGGDLQEQFFRVANVLRHGLRTIAFYHYRAPQPPPPPLPATHLPSPLTLQRLRPFPCAVILPSCSSSPAPPSAAPASCPSCICICFTAVPLLHPAAAAAASQGVVADADASLRAVIWPGGITEVGGLPCPPFSPPSPPARSSGLLCPSPLSPPSLLVPFPLVPSLPVTSLPALSSRPLPLVPSLPVTSLPALSSRPLPLVPSLPVTSLPALSSRPLPLVPSLPVTSLPALSSRPLPLVPSLPVTSLPALSSRPLPLVPSLPVTSLPALSPLPLPLVPSLHVPSLPTLSPHSLSPPLSPSSLTTLSPLAPPQVPLGAFPKSSAPLQIAVPNKKVHHEFVFVGESSNGTSSSNDKFSGFCIDVFKSAVALLPYTLSYQFVAYGDGQTPPSYDAMLSAVANKTYDAAVGDITITSDRALLVDFTQPFERAAPNTWAFLAPFTPLPFTTPSPPRILQSSGLSFVVPVQRAAPNTWAFLAPFTPGMWVLLYVSFFYTALVVWFLEHLQNEDFGGKLHQQLATSVCSSLLPSCPHFFPLFPPTSSPFSPHPLPCPPSSPLPTFLFHSRLLLMSRFSFATMTFSHGTRCLPCHHCATILPPFCHHPATILPPSCHHSATILPILLFPRPLFPHAHYSPFCPFPSLFPLLSLAHTLSVTVALAPPFFLSSPFSLVIHPPLLASPCSLLLTPHPSSLPPSSFTTPEEQVRTTLGRTVVIVWLFVVFVISSAYTASLSSVLTDFTALQQGNQTVGYRAGSFTAAYMQGVGINESRLVAIDPEGDWDAVVQEQQVAVVVDEEPYLDIFLSDHCYYTKPPHAFATFNFGFAFQKGSSLTEDLSLAIETLAQTLSPRLALPNQSSPPLLSLSLCSLPQAFQRGSSLTADLSLAIETLAQNGQLQSLHDLWLRGKGSCRQGHVQFRAGAGVDAPGPGLLLGALPALLTLCYGHLPALRRSPRVPWPQGLPASAAAGSRREGGGSGARRAGGGTFEAPQKYPHPPSLPLTPPRSPSLPRCRLAQQQAAAERAAAAEQEGQEGEAPYAVGVTPVRAPVSKPRRLKSRVRHYKSAYTAGVEWSMQRNIGVSSSTLHGSDSNPSMHYDVGSCQAN
ncbi:unnamed protein product, partial [Closterium sp. Naga37s-1]